MILGGSGGRQIGKPLCWLSISQWVTPAGEIPAFGTENDSVGRDSDNDGQNETTESNAFTKMKQLRKAYNAMLESSAMSGVIQAKWSNTFRCIHPKYGVLSV